MVGTSQADQADNNNKYAIKSPSENIHNVTVLLVE